MNPLAYFDPDDPYPESDGQPMAENTEQERARADRLAERLRALGLEP